MLIDGYLYGANNGALLCVDFAKGKVKWSESSVGAASVCAADGRLYARAHKDGTTVLVEPSPDGYREKGKFKPRDEDRPKREERGSSLVWPHPVVANGGLFLRDQGILLCYDVRAK